MIHRGRFIYWFAKGILERHTKATILGILLGISATVFITRLTTIMLWFAISPTERIGIIGEYTPSTLPLSIQKEISLGLTTISEDGSAQPGFATNWEATDSGKTYLFQLRQDLTWHNGHKVTAEDVNYNIKNVTFSPLSNNQLKASLVEPYAPFPVLISKPIFGQNLNGFGPYKVTSLSLKGDIIQYLKLVPVIDKKQKIKEYRFYRTENQAIMAYKLGDIDELQDLSLTTNLTKWGKVTSHENIHYDRIVTIFFNVKHSLLSERGIRQALGYALPETSEEKSFSPISQNSWGYTDKIRHYSYNPAQVKKLLNTANFTPGSAEISISTFPQYVEVAQQIADSWTTSGIPTKVKIEQTIPSTFDVLLIAQPIPPDPDQYVLWHSTQQQINLTGYANAKIDKLLEDARREANIEKRKKLYADFQRFLVEDAPAIFYYYPKTYTITRG